MRIRMRILIGKCNVFALPGSGVRVHDREPCEVVKRVPMRTCVCA